MSYKVFMVVSADRAVDQMRRSIDSGDNERAMRISQELHAYLDDLRKKVETAGGRCWIHLYERTVCETEPDLAADLVPYLDSFEPRFGTKPAVGLGMSLKTAAHACERSSQTGEIEFDGLDGEPVDQEQSKELNHPPGALDPENPESPEAPDRDVPVDPEVVPMPPGVAPAEEFQARESLAAALVPPMPQVPQPQPEAEPQQEAEVEQKAEDFEERQPGDAIVERLVQIKEHLPEIMDMARRDPKGFQHAMSAVKGLIQLARMQKSLDPYLYEDLEKGLATGSRKYQAKFPVGTVRGGRVKVIVNGRPVWRSVRAGIVKDRQGRPVSVKSSNKDAKDGDPNN